MRIIHVMDHSLPGTDGYAIRAKYLLEAQVAAGHEVAVLTSPSQGDSAIDAVIAGVRYRRSSYSAPARKMVEYGAKHLVFGHTIRHHLGKILDQESFDIVHAHTPFTVARAALIEARRRRLPLVYEKRNLWEESARARGKASGRWPFYQLARSMDRRVTMHADAVCTITEALKAQTVAAGVSPERVFVVGNGVDTDAFTPRAAPPALRQRCANGGDFVIGFIGSFFTFEGLPMLAEVVARLRARHSQIRLVLVGDGEDRARLEQLVAKLDLGANVWLVGRIPHDQVLDYYAAMDVLVYPRHRSALTEMISPLKPLEPMAMGRCVVGSDVGGISELIRDGETGLLFEADSADSLEQQFERLLSGQVDAAALGERARAHVTAHRQWRHMAGCYELAYQFARDKLAPGGRGAG
jgi:PEP-CTERM/exosortase A-associated glycosyltransferase